MTRRSCAVRSSTAACAVQPSSAATASRSGPSAPPKATGIVQRRDGAAPCPAASARSAAILPAMAARSARRGSIRRKTEPSEGATSSTPASAPVSAAAPTSASIRAARASARRFAASSRRSESCTRMPRSPIGVTRGRSPVFPDKAIHTPVSPPESDDCQLNLAEWSGKPDRILNFRVHLLDCICRAKDIWKRAPGLL